MLCMKNECILYSTCRVKKMTDVEAVADLDRPVSLREFNERFDKFEKELEKGRQEEKRLHTDEIEKVEKDRADAWNKWHEGKVLEFFCLYYNIHHRLKGE